MPTNLHFICIILPAALKKYRLNSALITIGDEILIGQVLNTNAVWISQKLNELGVRVGEMIAIPDDREAIHSTLDRYFGKYGLLIMTGGLGPTSDDITKPSLADYFGTGMVTHRGTLERITTLFRERGWRLTDSNIRQADVPGNCTVLMNFHGTAPGMWFEKDGTILVSLPGIPYEMEGLMEDHVLPAICQRALIPHVVHRTIMTQGMPESYLADRLRHWESELPGCLKLAYLPRPGIVRLRLSAYGECAVKYEQLLQEKIDKLLEIIPKSIFALEDIPLEKALGNLLKEKGLTLSTAESCTGGTIASMITSIPGSSAYFQGSVVAYQNRIKVEQLGVLPGDLELHGAVSREVVEQMAAGVMKLFRTGTSIAVSGIAGPDGGTESKPVGTTWICVACGDQKYSERFRFVGTRDRIITWASNSAMQLLRRLILGNL
ncbi:MAG: CinA family nicotinamide mononucleotide deamidase-related protein [Bacteroidetes bacterium]|nr:MAG: CinA family nicotinamide mononucleotide deamidase-related protein [Bacteroidota bacterium]